MHHFLNDFVLSPFLVAELSLVFWTHFVQTIHLQMKSVRLHELGIHPGEKVVLCVQDGEIEIGAQWCTITIV